MKALGRDTVLFRVNCGKDSEIQQVVRLTRSIRNDVETRAVFNKESEQFRLGTPLKNCPTVLHCGDINFARLKNGLKRPTAAGARILVFRIVMLATKEDARRQPRAHLPGCRPSSERPRRSLRRVQRATEAQGHRWPPSRGHPLSVPVLAVCATLASSFL